MIRGFKRADGPEALIVGGGFFGATIAEYLVLERGINEVTLVEREPELLCRASFANQARVHNGYHYPRSFVTAFRSRVNLPYFVRDHAEAVRKDFTKVYAIARSGSKVNARQFERFCLEIGADFELADNSLKSLFDAHFVEAVYRVQEYAFDATKLRERMQSALVRCGVDIRLDSAVKEVRPVGDQFEVKIVRGDIEYCMRVKWVFNCTYSSLNHIGFTEGKAVRTALKHEIAELGLIRPPAELVSVGVTVMDGQFFSTMPFPALGLHTLSHVRYTPHDSWEDRMGLNPRARLEEYSKDSRLERMLRDVVRWMPCMRNAEPAGTMFEVKTVLVRNEADDGRPILFERHSQWPRFFSVLGGKLDNVYDILERLRAEKF